MTDKDTIILAIRRFASGNLNGSPKDAIMSVEDWIDYPPHTIDERMADKILSALESAGFEITRKSK